MSVAALILGLGLAACGSGGGAEGGTTPLAGVTSTSNINSPLGTNLDGIAYYSPQLPFVDVMKSSSEWISGSTSGIWNDGRTVDTDGDGWVTSLAPGQVARLLMLREIGDRYPAGQYLVRYKGEGTLTFGFAASVVSQKAGEVLLQVTPGNGGIYMAIEATNPANYLRDIEIVMPGGICEGDPFTHVASAQACGSKPFLSFADNHEGILFYPVFADRLRAYSVLRFMDWMRTNNSAVTNWSQRTPLSYRTWTKDSGAPIEVMIALANRVRAHPWFTMPHQSDDAYAQNFAQMIKAGLDPELRVYVEHSNEVWNSMFSQYAYGLEKANAQQPPIGPVQYHASRTREFGRIFKAALGESRVVVVLGAQAVNPWTATSGLEYLKSQIGPNSTLGIDAVAIAPYFGVSPSPAQLSLYNTMTLDSLFEHVRTVVLPQTTEWPTNYSAVARAYGLRLIAYEGGQHLVGKLGAENDVALNDLFDRFNRDPRIKQLYLSYLSGWKQSGGELFVHFTDVGRYTKWGRWGALEYIAQPRAESPKFDAIQTFIEQNPLWWSP